MLTIDVDFLHGTVRAGGPDGLAATGLDDRGEWPPSPARLLSALVAADGTRGRCRVTTGEELRALERAAPPMIRADAATDVVSEATLGRYVVDNARSPGSVQNYPGRTAAETRAPRRLAPRHAQVTYVWPDLDLSERQVGALRLRAARIGYLGCADSPARVRVTTLDEPVDVGRATWTPSNGGPGRGVALPVPYDGFVDALDDAYDQFAAGVPVQRSWIRSVRCWYGADSGRTDPPVVWLRLTSPESGRHCLSLTATLRAAVMSHWSVPDEPAVPVPPVISGHGLVGEGYEHARWLALPDAGHPHARGRIHGIAVWLPADTPDDVVERLREAVARTANHGLRLPGGHLVELVTSDGTSGPLAARAERWCGPARTWTTVLPAVHERWSGHRQLTLAEVRRWCAHAGLPEPVAILDSPVPLVAGAVSLRPHETRRAGDQVRPFSHLRVHFPEDVSGPVAIGRGRHFGLGLLLPDRRRS